MKIHHLTLALGMLIFGAAGSAQAVTAECSDAETSIFTRHREAVTRAETIRHQVWRKSPLQRTTGVRIYMAAQPGLNVPYLQRAANCALKNANGAVDASSPLAVADVRAVASARGAELVLELTSANAQSVDELVRRTIKTP